MRFPSVTQFPSLFHKWYYYHFFRMRIKNICFQLSFKIFFDLKSRASRLICTFHKKSILKRVEIFRFNLPSTRWKPRLLSYIKKCINFICRNRTHKNYTVFWVKCKRPFAEKFRRNQKGRNERISSSLAKSKFLFCEWEK